MKIPDLASYLLSAHSKLSSASTTPESLGSLVVEDLGWLFPEEIDMIINIGTGHADWGKCKSIRNQDEGKKEPASVPLGLRNRWRIWKILRGIRIDREFD